MTTAIATEAIVILPNDFKIFGTPKSPTFILNATMSNATFNTFEIVKAAANPSTLQYLTKIRLKIIFIIVEINPIKNGIIVFCIE